MPQAPGRGPRIVHQTATRLRIRWRRLLAPDLDADYLSAWLGNLPGVKDVRVNPGGSCIVVAHDGRDDAVEGILAALAAPPTQAFQSKKSMVPRRRLADAAFYGVLAGAVPFLPPAAQGVVATAMGAGTVLRGADTLINEGLKARTLDMATIGASLLRADFATASSIAAWVVAGEYLRDLNDDRSNSLLKRLIADPVDEVWVDRGGREYAVGFDEVVPGDVALFGSGELVAVDGAVRQGKAMLDTGSITGESAPVMVSAGDRVLSGSVVVEGRLKVDVLRGGAQTNMARIAEFMTRALGEQSLTERKSARLADALAPITFGLAAALYAATGDMERALSVLTIDFACAVKLPSPVVLKTSMYAAAKEGVLFKSGTALEQLAEVDAVVFDKTGTLTMGELSITDIVLAQGNDEDEFLRLAAAVEDRYGHPIGRGVIREAERRGLPPREAVDVDLSVAHGVSGMVDGQLVSVGSLHFINDDRGVDCSALAAETAKLHSQGKSLVYVARGDRLEGVAALRDTVRPEADDVVGFLRDSGISKIIMLTGDHEDTAKSFASTFPHIDEFLYELSPEDKAAVVASLKNAGHRVAVVGDGVNDAPAFTAADVGICMSRSKGLARESAQVVLESDSLAGLITARTVALRVDGILQACFNAGVGVNVGLLLAAGAGMLRPASAAALHNLNTFAILGAAAWAATRSHGVPDAPA